MRDNRRHLGHAEAALAANQLARIAQPDKMSARDWKVAKVRGEKHHRLKVDFCWHGRCQMSTPGSGCQHTQPDLGGTNFSPPGAQLQPFPPFGPRLPAAAGPRRRSACAARRASCTRTASRNAKLTFTRPRVFRSRPQELLAEIASLVEERLGLCSGQDFLHLAAAMARLRFRPPLPWLHRFLGHSRNKLTSASPAQLTLLLRALSRLEYDVWDVKAVKTFGPWMASFLAVTKVRQETVLLWCLV